MLQKHILKRVSYLFLEIHLVSDAKKSIIAITRFRREKILFQDDYDDGDHRKTEEIEGMKNMMKTTEAKKRSNEVGKRHSQGTFISCDIKQRNDT